MCYANANLLRAEQHGEVLRFVDFWNTTTGTDPDWLYFDSKLTDYPELSRQLYRRFIETGGVVEVGANQWTVCFDKRSHNPILREAALDRDYPPISWIGNLSIAFSYP